MRFRKTSVAYRSCTGRRLTHVIASRGVASISTLPGGANDPTPNIIAIVGGSSTGFYLMRFAEGWHFITDTWHETLDEAFEQAEFEYEGVSQTWQPDEEET